MLQKAAIERAHAFHEVIARLSCRYMPTFTLNDGAVAYRDMSPRAKSVTFDFLCRATELFFEVNYIDMKNGFPGARMVISPGFRVRRDLNFDKLLNHGKGKRIKEKLIDETIDDNQAINEALKVRSHSDSTPELQANFAFAKAYIAESSGSKGGLPGPKCYIDISLFESNLPEWIRFNKIIEWQDMDSGMTAKFGELQSINKKLAADNHHNGILDAFDIAEAIGTTEKIIQKLREGKVGNLR